ncbi:hypothetical protein FOCC_FOCC006211 [Frankliniella occidentalis]|uniref:Uncharacterized protein LOC113214958 n=1 Tax=Frankliniella occidentalis TaxID=133901 RepID=A0A9C6WXT7_FRAOC|nr:uncharacterized protein LOC113214958 [Frankliniella occidentalis]KAE8747073.1 hypothetical protein FOCC_FOCC006211 [Frankliniella occidentalis]
MSRSRAALLVALALQRNEEQVPPESPCPLMYSEEGFMEFERNVLPANAKPHSKRVEILHTTPTDGKDNRKQRAPLNDLASSTNCDYKATPSKEKSYPRVASVETDEMRITTDQENIITKERDPPARRELFKDVDSNGTLTPMDTFTVLSSNVFPKTTFCDTPDAPTTTDGGITILNCSSPTSNPTSSGFMDLSTEMEEMSNYLDPDFMDAEITRVNTSASAMEFNTCGFPGVSHDVNIIEEPLGQVINGLAPIDTFGLDAVPDVDSAGPPQVLVADNLEITPAEVIVAEEDNNALLPARSAQPATWKKNEAKSKKNAGEKHTSLKGKEVKAVEMKPRCTEVCNRNCKEVSEEERKKIFDCYYKLSDRTAKWRYISAYIHSGKILKRTVVVHDEAEAKKNCSNSYFLPAKSQGKEIQVCQTMFLNTLAISATTMKTALAKRRDKFGVISPNKMGKGSKKTPERKKLDESVKDHISRFPTVESHYCRKSSTARYLDENLNRRKMYNLYVMECQGKGMDEKNIASLRRYRDIFKTYRLKFYKPKKDQCPKCLAWKHKKPQTRTPKDEEKIKEHLAQKTLGRDLKEADANFVTDSENRKELCVITCDLQKMMNTPKGENGEFFYKSKFSTYNFTVFVSGEQQGYCYAWHQTVGRKGCTEITSCLWSFIQLQAAKGIKEIRIYSDNCAAQNKNQYLFSMYVMASIRYGLKITHRYLEAGHTQMQCDAMHARIELFMKNTDVFVPSQWITAMKMAKVKNPKYIVKEMSQEDLFDFAPLAAHQDWENVRTSLFREVVVDGKDPGLIKYKTHFDRESVTKQIILPKRGRPVNWKTFPLHRKYPQLFPVPKKVLSGLQNLCKTGAIPAQHAEFYQNYLPSLDQQGVQVVEPPASDVSDIESDEEDFVISEEEDAANEGSDN